MRTTITIILTLVLARLSSQTVTPSDIYDPPTKTVGNSTPLTCREMKPNCKPGKLVTCKRRVQIDTLGVGFGAEGYIADMTGKKLPRTFFTFTNQKTKTPYLNITDSLGRLRIFGLPEGTYSLKANAFGYQDFIVSDLKFGDSDIWEIIIDMGEYCCTKVDVELKNHDDKTKTDK